MKLSIVVPVYNERVFLPRILEKLTQALEGVEKEVVIVDDCSTDGTREWIRENFAEQIKYVRGFAAGANGEIQIEEAELRAGELMRAVAGSSTERAFADQFMVDQPSAVGMRALWDYFEEHPHRDAVCVETAHPAKFPDLIEREVGVRPAPTEALERISRREGTAHPLENRYETFKRYLLED